MAEVAEEEARRLRGLAEFLRAGGERRLVHCAWCGRFNVRDEWVDLGEKGLADAQVHDVFFEHSSHGICPTCFDHVQRAADAERRGGCIAPGSGSLPRRTSTGCFHASAPKNRLAYP